MSGGGGAGPSKAAAPIPAGARKLVQSLKEIVNCPESEIYAMLRECNMDPDEAVNRLLTQDTFQEVRSKRDKKKEIKEPPESRSRAVNNNSGRGPRSGPDRVGRNTSSQTGSTDYGVSRSKPVGKKENGANAIPTSLMSENTMVGSNPSLRSTVSSYSVENTLLAANPVDRYSTPSQPSNWLGKPGHVSMADIVKNGRPSGKPSNIVQNASTGMPHHSLKPSTSVIPSESEKKMVSSQESVLHIPEVDHHIGTAEDQHIAHDGWSIVHEPPTRSIVPETSHVSDLVATSSSLVVDGVDLNIGPHMHETEAPQENLNRESIPEESRSVSISDKQTHVEAYGDAPLNDDHEGSFPVKDASVEISSVTANLNQISLHDESSTKVIESNPAVIIPDHLQVTNADCAQLSFGSFASGAFAGSFSAKSPQTNVEVAPVADNDSSMDQSDSRNEYYNNGELQPTLNEDVPSRSSISAENLDTSSVSQAEVSRNDTLNPIHGLGYELPSVSYAFSSTTQPNATPFNYPQANAQMQNFSSISSLMQPNTLQSNILSPNVPALRDFELPFSHLLTTQSISSKHMSAPSAIGTPNISVQEAVKQGYLSNPQPSQQNLASTTIPTGPTPQQLAVHQYTQAALPLGPFANMISYPFLTPSYSYLPSAAFQQTYSLANGPFQQSPTSVPNAGIKYGLPQYKNSVSLTSLPQSAAVASAYGGFNSSANIPGNFTINPSTSSASTTAGFEEALSFQYREANQYMPLQQSDNPAMWVQNAGSRTMSALPASTYYQSQSQQSGFRQNQLPSQFGALGYPNFYQSQAGASQEHQQNPSDGNLNSSQSAESQPVNHLWQHGY